MSVQHTFVLVAQPAAKQTYQGQGWQAGHWCKFSCPLLVKDLASQNRVVCGLLMTKQRVRQFSPLRNRCGYDSHRNLDAAVGPGETPGWLRPPRCGICTVRGTICLLPLKN